MAEAAGVAASTVSRALSKPGRVSFRTAEHVRKVAAELGYRMELRQRSLPGERTHLLAMIVADITNPVFFGLIRGAERTATHAGYTLVLAETQESEQAERQLLERLAGRFDGIILASSRLSDGAIRAVAKTSPLVVLNRFVDQVPSVTSDNVRATKRVVEHLAALGHRTITYLSGPEASWADSMRWRGLLEAGHELEIKVRRIGPYLPTINGGRQAAERWRKAPTTGVVAYNDLVAIGFMQAVAEAGLEVPRDVSVVGFDNIRDAGLVQPEADDHSLAPGQPRFGGGEPPAEDRCRADPPGPGGDSAGPGRPARVDRPGPGGRRRSVRWDNALILGTREPRPAAQ